MCMANKKSLPLYLTDDLRKRLSKSAKLNKRSLTAEAEFILEQALNNKSK